MWTSAKSIITVSEGNTRRYKPEANSAKPSLLKYSLSPYGFVAV